MVPDVVIADFFFKIIILGCFSDLFSFLRDGGGGGIGSSFFKLFF